MELERSVYRLRVVLILTHNLPASVIEVGRQGSLSLDGDWLFFPFAVLSSKEGANRRSNEVKGSESPQTSRLRRQSEGTF